jgi:hypothetical protein
LKNRPKLAVPIILWLNPARPNIVVEYNTTELIPDIA